MNIKTLLAQLLTSEIKDDFKRYFISLVVEVIKQNPDWMKDLIWAVQKGVMQSLEQSETDKANLAYTLSSYVDKHPVFTEKNKKLFQKGLRSLFKFFTGSDFGKEIEQYITKDE